MSASTPSSIRDAVRRLADNTLGEPVSSEHVASTGTRLIEALCRKLAALVGDSGIGAVLDRAVKDVHDLGGHVAGTPAAPPRRWEAHLEPIGEQLRRLDPVAARAALLALLDTFVVMVCTFLGEALTLRSLQELT